MGDILNFRSSHYHGRLDFVFCRTRRVSRPNSCCIASSHHLHTNVFLGLPTTAISSDQYYMGAIGISGGETWSLTCINEPFTTSGVYAGCGYDDLYTSCSGSFAYGADGDVIRCASGAPCVTHSVFEDFEAYNSSSSTNFVGCGYGTATLEIVRSPLASASTIPTSRSTSNQITPSPTTSTQNTADTGEVTSSSDTSGAATSTDKLPLYAGGSIGLLLFLTLFCV